MKHLVTTLAFLLSLMVFGCGDTTNINGYSEEDVAKMLSENKDTVYQVTQGDSVLTYIYVTDTLYNEIVDTVYNRVTDTLYRELVDTVYNKVVDTVMTTLVDTIVTRVIDTVITTMVDTIYTRVIDTVFTTLNTIGVDTELPRDTTITLSEDFNGSTITKTFSGIVFKGVFYETKLYQYADTSRSKGTYYPLTTSQEICDMYSNNLCDIYTIVSQCGGVLPPSDGIYHLTYSRSQTKTYITQYQTFTGWRLFDDSDAYKLRNMLDQVIEPNAQVFLSKISATPFGSLFNEGFKEWNANVATTNGITVANKPMHYMCAYDLN